MLSDLAIIKPISSNHIWKKAMLGSNTHLRPGDWAFAIGSPFGLQHTVTVGVVSSRSRKSLEIGGLDSPVEFIQTDCVIHRGSSGGPLVNIDGEIIGIITTRAEGEGISFAIRIDNILGIIDQMMKMGRVIRPWIGLKMISFEDAMRMKLDSPIHKGVYISEIVPESPAEKAGLLPGDYITAIDQEPVQTTQQILKKMGLRVGQSIPFTVHRNQALEQDWDGRIMRYETECLHVTVIPRDLSLCFESIYNTSNKQHG